MEETPLKYEKSLIGTVSGLPGSYAVKTAGLLALKMKALRSFYSPVTIYHSTRYNVPEV